MAKPRKGKNGRKSTKKITKSLRAAVKAVVISNVETKGINAPDSTSGTTNTIFQPYAANQGLAYLVQDVFKLPQGVEDSSVIGAPNRIGDRVKGVGFLMDYFFTMQTSFPLGAASYIIPYVKLRVIVWKQAFGSPLLNTPLLLDSNYLLLAGPTLRPINWDEGYVKDVLYDRVHVIKAQMQASSGAGTLTNPPFSGLYHLKKYIKFPHNIKYCENNSTSPNSTTNPIYIGFTAECEEGTAFIPTGQKIMFVTGYTKAWFKDA